MLSSLHIENIAIIKSLDADFSNGFTVFTGETGAGKSIIIDSIDLLLGGKAPKDIIRTGEKTALVSGVFDMLSENTVNSLAELGISAPDGSVMLQRTLSADLKSTYRINGRAVTMSLAKEIGRLLINIHGQHDSESLRNPSKHIYYLDDFASIDTELSEYRLLYNEMCEVKRELERYIEAERNGIRKAELLEYQINDISSAELTSGEEDELISEKKLLENSKALTKQVSTVYRALYKNQKGASASQLIEIARKSLDEMADFYQDASKFSEKLFDIESELQSIAGTVAALLPSASYDVDARLSEIDDRLDVIRRLKRKYGATVDEVLAFCENAVAELDDIKSCSEKIDIYTKKYQDIRKKALDAAMKLNGKRCEAALLLSENIASSLKFLDMEKVTFSVRVTLRKKENGDYEFDSNGVNGVEFYISTNIGEPQKPLSSIASGGELSRIMLTVKIALNGKEAVPTVIFDEADTGVSGKTSQKMGIKLYEFSRNAQVLCITHSAQIAAIADTHYLIKKHEDGERTYTVLVNLDYDERARELARIMGGVNITQKVMDTAAEMLTEAKKLKN